MRKLSVIVILIVIATAGLFAWFLYSNRAEEADRRVEQSEAPSTPSPDEPLQGSAEELKSEDDAPEIVSEGTFGVGERDYSGSGTARFVRDGDKVRLEFADDFSVTNGPDLFVYISPNDDAIEDGLGDFASLGPLKAETGAQVYTLPDGFERYESVVIWCRTFQGVFSQAELS